MKVYLKAYLKNNLGDDLFVETICKRYPGSEFHIITSEDNCTFSCLRNLVIHKPNILTKIVGKIMHVNFWERVLRYGTDIMVYIGGSIFMEKDKRMLIENEKIYRNRKPFYIIGFNIGPYKNSSYVKYINENIFNRSTFLSVRDSESYDLIDAKDRTVCVPDVIFTSTNNSNGKPKEKYAVISVVDMQKRADSKLAKKYEEYIVKLCEELKGRKIKPILMSFCKYEGDEELINRINSEGNMHSYFYRGNTEEAKKLINEAFIVFGSRFHASILALNYNVPLIPFAYSSKTTNLLKLIKYEGEVLDINNLDMNNIGLTIDNAISYKPSKTSIEKIKKDAKLHFKELDKVLE